MSIDSTTERPSARQEKLEGIARPYVTALGVPWKTVLALGVVLTYADGFWLTSLRGAAGAIERTQSPFASWLRESTLVLPVFVLAVLAAMTLALRWFGPVLTKPSTVTATVLLIVAASTLAGLSVIVASSAYDYHLQSAQLQLMQQMSAMHGSCSAQCLAQQQHDTLAIHVRAVVLISRWILLTNLVLVAWLVAMWGGRLKVATTRRQPDTATDTDTDADTAADTVTGTGRGRVGDLRRLLAAGLVGSATIHAAVAPGNLTHWAAAAVFFIVLAVVELAVAALLVARPHPGLLLAAAAVSIGPLALWEYSRTVGLPFGPGAGAPYAVGLSDSVACALEVGMLLVTVVLMRAGGWLGRRPRVSAHVNGLILVALLAITAIGVAGTGLSWADAFGISGSHPVMDMSH